MRHSFECQAPKTVETNNENTKSKWEIERKTEKNTIITI